MKLFGATLIIFLTAVFTLNWIADPSSMLALFSPRLIKLALQNPKRCALDSAILSSTRNTFFSQWLLEQSHENTIIVVGTSRVQAIRGENFFPERFVNFGVGGTDANDYPRLVEFLRKHPQVKTLLISTDIWDFVKTGGFRIYDALTSFRNPTLRKLSTGALRAYLDIGSSAHYASFGERAWSVFVENLSYTATRKTLVRLWHDGRFVREIYEIPLGEKSAISSKCLLSTTPELNRNGAVSAIDNSQYTPEDLIGLPLKTDTLEFEKSSILKTGTHWRLYDPMKFSKEFSSFRFSYMEYLLTEAAKLHVNVIGYEPPFPQPVASIIEELGLIPMWHDFDQKMTALFNQHGSHFTSFSEMSCPTSEFTDGWHPWSGCMHRALKKILSAPQSP